MVSLNQVVNIYFCGYDVNPAILAGVGLGTTFMNVTYFAVCFGLNGVMQSLVAQANGAGNLRQSGIYVNRARLVLTLWLPFAIFFSFFLGKTFEAIGIDQETSNVAQIYTTRQIPGLIAFMYFDIGRQYLVARELDPQYKSSWFLGGKETFKNLGEYVKLAVPSAILQCLEFAGFEMLCILSGYISVTANAAQVITLTTNIMFYQIPIGLMIASTTIIGELIGQRKSKLAKAQSCFIIKINYISGLIMGSILFIFRYQLARAFSSNEEVIEITSNAFIFSSVSHVLDFIYAIQTGSIRALTKFNLAVLGGFIAFYVFACPLGSLFALYFKLGVPGLWLGLIMGQFIVVSYFQYLLSWGFDWEQIIQKSYERQEAEIKMQNKQENLLVNNHKILSNDGILSIEMQKPQKVVL
ncbi:na+-driven multidrug efflux pump [Stylonychia lemnae]|uniref:Na+-driven multidrug efflux pump n=1 Tax=Stylonychia lemnae TaxID=5949 RepID=A0A078AIE5_STYLE|nr:na+-driven multidrug efflux pump [Stylonychia lemnae]|eukprot:CDW81989.1 na+-driven multidrug efflux pump [Stylonychia lemnae]